MFSSLLNYTWRFLLTDFSSIPITHGRDGKSTTAFIKQKSTISFKGSTVERPLKLVMMMTEDCYELQLPISFHSGFPAYWFLHFIRILTSTLYSLCSLFVLRHHCISSTKYCVLGVTVCLYQLYILLIEESSFWYYIYKRSEFYRGA